VSNCISVSTHTSILRVSVGQKEEFGGRIVLAMGASVAAMNSLHGEQ
jgi:hypothetical protein